MLHDAQAMSADWNYPTSIHFGAGRISEVADLCRQLDIKNPLLVTDSSLKDMDFIAGIIQVIENAGLGVDVFSEVKPNPVGENISAGVAFYRNGNHDGVIAVGGGSGLDAGKAIALMCGQDVSIWELEDSKNNWQIARQEGMSPVIAIPTTAGTGSEVGRASVILDQAEKCKKIIFHPRMLPEQVILDPELTIGLPGKLTAATGMDAFVHCFEAYCSPGYHPLADGIALEGMRIISQWLPEAVQHGSNVIARGNMLTASMMGATAFQKGLGAVHALAHPLGALYDAHHGLLNAILLPYVMQANRDSLQEKSTAIARYIGLGNETFDALYSWVMDFRQKLEIPGTLGQIGITDKDSTLVAQMAFVDPSAAGNPVAFTAEEYKTIFCHAVNGLEQ